ncbi:ACHA6-like protein [Mya arenaria]|uniref:ACHA6-like protein n=1 Tax=Mya arenaria TaxID=6604 RepID=A0ABY7EGW3_MYAAR|nr:ACHA6-like protein [Mya arenaria]
MSLAYKNNEVNLLKIGQTGIDFTLYQNNSLWEITSTSVYVETLATGTELQMHFILYLKRKSAYMVLNVLMPILFLSLLNALVFWLVPESGERIGYCITTLLAIAVYMTIVMDYLPQSSDPVPFISYKLVIDLISSSLIIVVVIFNMRLHNKAGDQNVPGWLRSLYRALACYNCKQKKVNPEIIQVKVAAWQKKETVENGSEEKKKIAKNDGDLIDEDGNKITWQDISAMRNQFSPELIEFGGSQNLPIHA